MTISSPIPLSPTGLAVTQLEQWTLRRAGEKSTWIGIALIATNLGWPSVAAHITGLGELAPAILATLGAGLAAASTSPHPLAPSAPADPALDVLALITPKGSSMSIMKIVRGLLGIVATAIAPSWNKELADTFAQAEAALTPIIGDEAKKLAQDAEATGVPGFTKLGNIVGDLVTIAATKGIKADAMVVTVIATKAVAQIKADAPALIETTLDTAISAAAGPVAGAIAAPLVAGAAASLTAA